MSAKKEKGLSWRKSEAKLVNDAFYFTGLNGKDTVLYKKKFVHCQCKLYTEDGIYILFVFQWKSIKVIFY